MELSFLHEQIARKKLPHLRLQPIRKKKNLELVLEHKEKRMKLIGPNKGNYALFLTHWFNGNYSQAQEALGWKNVSLRYESKLDPDWYLLLDKKRIESGSAVQSYEEKKFKHSSNEQQITEIINDLIKPAQPILFDPPPEYPMLSIGEGPLLLDVAHRPTLSVDHLFPKLREFATQASFVQSNSHMFSIEWNFTTEVLSANCYVFRGAEQWDLTTFLKEFPKRGRRGSVQFQLGDYSQKYEQNAEGSLNFIGEKEGEGDLYDSGHRDPFKFLVNKTVFSNEKFLQPGKSLDSQDFESLLRKLSATADKEFSSVPGIASWSFGKKRIVFHSLGEEHADFSQKTGEHLDYTLYLQKDAHGWTPTMAIFPDDPQGEFSLSIARPYEYLSELLVLPGKNKMGLSLGPVYIEPGFMTPESSSLAQKKLIRGGLRW